jgi:hypothetical protein
MIAVGAGEVGPACAGRAAQRRRLDIGTAEFGNAIEEAILMFFDSRTRELLRTRPNPLTWEQARARRGARPAWRPPRPSAEPVTVQRRASNTGVTVVAGQKIARGRIHCGQIVTVTSPTPPVTIDLGGDDIRTIRRTTTQPVRSIKAHRPRHADAENQEAAR